MADDDASDLSPPPSPASSSPSDEGTNDAMIAEAAAPTTANNDTNNNGQPPPRLMITKMVLENFKSYAGVKEIGPFHKCFSAVVGPNGSGKSNVIDGMLFVFGKRAKKLRLNKVRELIHKSDAVKNNPPTYARVSVYFQEIIDTGEGDDDFDVVPNSEHVVTRVAKQDNSSNYKLDGKNCSFRDVAAFLESKGIDLDNNRFLILQGEVEMISMMPPKGKTEDDDGLLEYLEDIIGSSKFVEDTNEAALKVEQLTEQRQEKLNRVKAAAQEKDSLQGAKEEAENLLGKEREIRRKRNVLYQIHVMHETTHLKSVTEKKNAVAQLLEEEREKESHTVERIKELEKALKQQNREYDKIHDELKVTKQEFTTYERQDIKLREEIKHAKAEQKKTQIKITTENKKEEDAIRKGQEAEDSIAGLEEDIVKFTQAKEDADEKLDVIQEEVKGLTQGLRAQLEEKTQELAPINQERAEFQAHLDTAKTEVQLLEDATTRAKEKLLAAEEELKGLDEKQQSKRDELAGAKSELAHAKDRVAQAEEEEATLAEREGALAQKSKDLMARSEEAKAAKESGGNARNPAVKGILKAARKDGELSKVGILGRLGDLATIAEEYDIAVSTACGMLDHIVVQTTAGAQRCLEYLRKHQLGRAQFIPLDKMKKGAHDRQVETPEGAPRLFELMNPVNFSVAPALFLAVGNTLVAPDLETATRWAYEFDKRWRVVTLDGKLISNEGTMSGGGKVASKGGMRIANAGSRARVDPLEDTSAEDCKRLEQEAKQALELVQQCRQRRRELTEEMRSLKRTIKSLEVKLPKLSMEIDGCDTTREKLTQIIPKLRSETTLSAPDAARLKNLQGKVDKIKSDMASCETLASALEADVAKLQKAILDAGGTKLKKQQSACDKALLTLNDAEKSLNAAKVAIASNEKAAQKASKAKAAAEKQLKESEELLAEKEKEFKKLEENAVQVRESYENVKKVEADKRKELEDARKDCEDIKAGHNKAKVAELGLLAKAEEYEAKISDCERKKKDWENKLSKLREAEEEDDEYDFSDEEEDDVDGEQGEKRDEGGKADDDGDVVMTAESDEESSDAPKRKQKNVTQEASSKSSLPTFPFAALERYSVDGVKAEIDRLETERNTLAKNANMNAINDYRKKEADYLARVEELDKVSDERNAARKVHEELRRQRLEMFMEGFGKITLKLKEMYQMITLGGDAELELVDSLDPFSEGIVFSVRPPKKSWKNISNLSGGEKTLSSLALVFALHHYKPTPLYVMDEIDAALDFKNVSIVANYIKERTKNAQFIIISLRNNCFELSDRLVGIYKTNNCTKSVTINPWKFGVSHRQDGQTPFANKTNKRGVVSTVKGRQIAFSGDGETQEEYS